MILRLNDSTLVLFEQTGVIGRDIVDSIVVDIGIGRLTVRDGESKFIIFVIAHQRISTLYSLFVLWLTLLFVIAINTILLIVNVEHLVDPNSIVFLFLKEAVLLAAYCQCQDNVYSIHHHKV